MCYRFSNIAQLDSPKNQRKPCKEVLFHSQIVGANSLKFHSILVDQNSLKAFESIFTRNLRVIFFADFFRLISLEFQSMLV